MTFGSIRPEDHPAYGRKLARRVGGLRSRVSDWQPMPPPEALRLWDGGGPGHWTAGQCFADVRICSVRLAVYGIMAGS